jgi:hypothetical protein
MNDGENSIIVQMLNRLDGKVDALRVEVTQGYMPRPEVETRLNQIQDQHDRAFRAMKWAFGSLVGVVGVGATIFGTIKGVT